MFSKGGIDVYSTMGTRVLYACAESPVVCEPREREWRGLRAECEFDIVSPSLLGDALDMLSSLKDSVTGPGLGLSAIPRSDSDNDLRSSPGCVDFTLARQEAVFRSVGGLTGDGASPSLASTSSDAADTSSSTDWPRFFFIASKRSDSRIRMLSKFASAIAAAPSALIPSPLNLPR